VNGKKGQLSKTACLFGGQGTQYIGMGKEFYEHHEECRHGAVPVAALSGYPVRYWNIRIWLRHALFRARSTDCRIRPRTGNAHRIAGTCPSVVAVLVFRYVRRQRTDCRTRSVAVRHPSAQKLVSSLPKSIPGSPPVPEYTNDALLYGNDSTSNLYETS